MTIVVSDSTFVECGSWQLCSYPDKDYDRCPGELRGIDDWRMPPFHCCLDERNDSAAAQLSGPHGPYRSFGAAVLIYHMASFPHGVHSYLTRSNVLACLLHVGKTDRGFTVPLDGYNTISSNARGGVLDCRAINGNGAEC